MKDARCVLVAHGTRNPLGVEVVAALADALTSRVGPTRVAFVDVLGPSPSEVLRDSPQPVVLVPAFLASGYHVHADVPREVADSGHGDVVVTRALGPDPALAVVMAERLREVGWRTGDHIVLAAAGSSDDRAQRDVARAAGQLAAQTRSPVRIGVVATGTPRAVDVVDDLRRDGRRVFVASYLLAPGLFHTRLLESGADGVTEPLGVHPGVVDVLEARFREGLRASRKVAAESRPGR